MAQETFDVAVVGAGAVGLTAALAFAARGFRTALVGPPAARRDGRTAALLGRSVRLLETFGLSPALDRDGAPLRRMRLVDDTGSLFRPPPTTFAAAEIGLPEFGWNIENDALVRLLAERVRATPLIGWHEALVAGYEERSVANLTLAGGETVAASLVCAADGRESRLRQAIGIEPVRRALPQAAFTTILAHDRPHEFTSTEFHTRAGPCTLVPLPGSRSSLVWVTRPRHAARLMEASDRELCDAITARTGGLLGSIAIAGPRGAFPLATLTVPVLHKGRVVLLGEAAHALPPIGAQGLNLGLADVDVLASLCAERRRPGDDLGRSSLPRLYDEARRGEVAWRGFGVNALNRALLSPLPPVDVLRGVGLGLLGRVAPLRRAAMRAGLT